MASDRRGVGVPAPVVRKGSLSVALTYETLQRLIHDAVPEEIW